MSTLPTPRHLLINLINTLTITPPPTQPIPPPVNKPYSAPSNPLTNLVSSQRALLTTLHVLFPPPMLLQALDLLDRGLVLRVIEQSPALAEILRPSGQAGEGAQSEMQQVYPPKSNIHLPSPAIPSTSWPPDQITAPEKREKRNQVYQVRSSQPPKSRFRGSVTTGNAVYTVRLTAWSCSCAAFAFSAFPGGGSSSSAPWSRSDEEDDEWMKGARGAGKDERKKEWDFGGLSSGGMDGGEVPVCKHLLACLLGERWDLLGSYVREREVSKEEMAGVGAE